MAKQICKILTCMVEIIMAILIVGIPVIISVAILVTMWGWLGA